MLPRILSCDIERFYQDLERVITAGNGIEQVIRDYSARTEKRYKVRLGCCELYHIFLPHFSTPHGTSVGRLHSLKPETKIAKRRVDSVKTRASTMSSPPIPK